MTANRLVKLARLSIGDRDHLTPAGRLTLAEEVRRLRAAQRALWAVYGEPRTYRIFARVPLFG